MSNQQIQSRLTTEIQSLIQNHWKWVDEHIPVLKKTINHRHEIVEISEISYIKKQVLNCIGYIPMFFFILWYGTCDHFGAQRNLEKAFLIVYQLIKGYSTHEMDNLIGSSSYYTIYKDMWINQYVKLNEWLTFCL